MGDTEHLNDFSVVEFRRYTLKEGQRDRFAIYFENFFPEAFEQLSAMVFGQFFERENPSSFTWIRGYHNIYDRGVICASFYYGPLWREHRSNINEMLIDSDNVLLLTPVRPGKGIPVLPAVDPTIEPGGPQGVVIAEVFPVKRNHVELFVDLLEPMFDQYRTLGVRDAGLLRTVDGPNTFPQHPIRTDGPFVIWLGIVRDSGDFETRIRPIAERFMPSLADMESLRGEPELLVLDPTRRSRLRWLPDGTKDDSPDDPVAIRQSPESVVNLNDSS